MAEVIITDFFSSQTSAKRSFTANGTMLISHRHSSCLQARSQTRATSKRSSESMSAIRKQSSAIVLAASLALMIRRFSSSGDRLVRRRSGTGRASRASARSEKDSANTSKAPVTSRHRKRLRSTRVTRVEKDSSAPGDHPRVASRYSSRVSPRSSMRGSQARRYRTTRSAPTWPRSRAEPDGREPR